jgi:hypothetical protein
MFSHLSFPEPNRSLQTLNFDLAIALFVIASRAMDYESLWEITSRVCDRYLPKPKHV